MPASKSARIWPILVLLGLALSLAVASIVVGRLDANALKPRLEASFERATGRVLRIAGPLRLSLLPSPGFVADEVSIDNLPGGSRPAMFVARKVTGSVDLLALLDRTIHVESVTLTDPDILFEEVGGRPNWRFQRSPTQGGSASTSAHPAARPGYRISELDAAGGRLAWQGLGKAGSGAVTIDRLHAQQQDRSSSTLFVAGHHRQTAFSLSLAAGPRSLAVPSGRPMPVRATLSLGHGENGDRLHLDGNVDLEAGRVDLRIHAVLPQVADLNGLFPHAALPTASDVTLDANLVADRSGRWRISRFAGAGRRLDLTAYRAGLLVDRVTATASTPVTPLSIDVAGKLQQVPFIINGLLGSLEFWQAQTSRAPIDMAMSTADNAASVRGSLSRQDSRQYGITAAISLHLPDPSRLNAGFGLALKPATIEGTFAMAGRQPTDFSGSLDAATLRVGNADLSGSRLKTTITPGLLVLQSSFAGASPWIIWREDLGQVPHHVVIRLEGSSLPAAPLFSLATGRPVVDGKLAINAMIEANATGSKLDDATINGPFDMTLVDASLEPSLLQSVLGEVSRTAHLPNMASSSARIRCADGVGVITNGTVAIKQLAVASPALIMTGRGNVDLPRGVLDFHLQPILRLGPTDLATSVALSGTTTSPIATLESNDGRVGFQIGHVQGDDLGRCAGAVDRPRKPPKPADFLRALGILR